MERAGLVVLLLSTVAGAHDFTTPKRDRLHVSPTEIRLRVEYSISQEDARALKHLIKKPLNYLVQQATHFVALTVDGKEIPMKVVQVLGNDLSVQVILAAKITKAQHIHFEDRHKDRRITVPVEVTLEGVQLATPLPPQPFVFADHPLDLDLK